ncbi:bacteriocin-like protein [Chryseobacterium sp. SIMBA_029]|uniref:bacteriocin-like protein n=1 Tax=Bacteria TaxID=2 RepID=UPI0039796B8A
MKNLKKMSRNALKMITGGEVICPMPSGIPAICPGSICPANPCTAVPYCRRAIQDCGPSGIF